MKNKKNFRIFWREDEKHSLKNFLYSLGYEKISHKFFTKCGIRITKRKIEMARNSWRSKKVHYSLFKDHHKLWIKTKENREKLKRLLTKLFTLFGEYLFHRIPKLTHTRWKTKDLVVYLTADVFWTISKKGLDIGSLVIRKRKVLGLTIHELIHFNTFKNIPKAKDTDKMVDEIATCVLTNILLDEINRKFNTEFCYIRFDKDYKKYQKYENEFKLILHRSENFEDFKSKIKKKLTQSNPKPT